MPRHPNRTNLFVAIALAALLPGSAFAQEYKLGPQDKLKISVNEWPDLTGEFTVSAVGAVAMPMVGTIPAAGLSPEALAGTIEQRLQERRGLPEKPDAVVEVSEYRPFFILGDVQSPGSFPFRPGMTVLQGVSIGGGFFRFTDPGLLRLEREAITSRGDLSVLGKQVDQYQVRRARLQAEIDDKQEITFPEDIMKRAGEPDIARLMREEQLLFESRGQTLAEQVQGLQRLIKLYQDEIVSLDAQAKAVSRQADLLNTELKSISSLVDRGLARAPQQLELERNAAEIVREQRELDTYILRAHESISQAEQNIIALRSQRHNETIAELQATQMQITEAGERVSTTQQLIFESEVTTPMERVEQDNTSKTFATYTLTRRDASGVARSIVADETTPVEPGDVINVQRSMRRGPTEPAPGGVRASALESMPGSQALNLSR